MEESGPKYGWLTSIVQTLAWFVAILGAVVDIFALREAYLALLAWYRVVSTQAFHEAGGLGVDIWTGVRLTAIDILTWVILCITALVAMIGIEYYFRKGREKGLLYKRIGKVLGIEAAIVVGAIIVRLIVAAILSGTA
jgi:hypothetical protein